MSSFTYLPGELILSIADHLDYSPDINHLSQTCRHLYNILNPYLYARNAHFWCRRGLWRAVELESESAVLKLIAHGANKDQWTQGTPERRQREKEERRWNRRNGVGSSRLFVDLSNSSSSSSSDEFCSLPSHSESGNDDGEEESESSESESGSERWQHSGRTYPVDDSDSDDSKLGKCTFMGNLKGQRRMAARYSKPPPNDQLLYTNEPRTPLIYLATSKGYNRIVEILLEHGAHPNACTDSNTTPFMAATDRRNVELIRLLL